MKGVMFAILASALSVGFVTSSLSASPVRQIWFAPLDNQYRNFLNATGSADFMQLFAADAPWQKAASKLQVFKLYSGYVLEAPPEDLRSVIADLQRRHIDLALETQILTPSGTCGRGGIEGYSDFERSEDVYQRIIAAGGTLKYVGMDEPLFFGHVSPRGCNSSIAELASDAATRVAHLKTLFPGVIIGDIEPITAFSEGDLPGVVSEWAAAYASATGQQLGFFHADIDWNISWQSRLTSVELILKQNGIPLGIIYDGAGGDQTDADWTGDLLRHAEETEDQLGVIPDHAILQSWFFHPRHVLPETLPGTFTAAILSYARDRPTIQANRSGNAIGGVLLNGSGQPIANAQVTLGIKATSGPGVYAPLQVSGVVPANSHSAILAVRINTECKCSADVDVAFSNFRYQQKDSSVSPFDSGSLYQQSRWNISGDGVVKIDGGPGRPHIAVTAKKNQNSQINLKMPFPVAQGEYYKFGVDLRSSELSNEGGVAAIIFRDVGGHELGRRSIPIRAGLSLTSTSALTDQDGHFLIKALVRDNARPIIVFKGDTHHRYAEFEQIK